MAFNGVTPEAMMARSDSRNPATTCKGLTKSGRPCRRPIDSQSNEGGGGVVAVSSLGDNSDEDEEGAAAYFCWQHKDQAEKLAAQPGPSTQVYPLQQRNSIDSLVQRLGVLDVADEGEERKGKGKKSRLQRPPTWSQVEGPLMSVPSDIMAQRRKKRHPTKKKQGFWSRLCCGEADNEEEEDLEAGRGRKRRDDSTQYGTAGPSHQHQQPQSHQKPQTPTPPRPKTPDPKPIRSKNEDYIPSDLPDDLSAKLLAELEKPISPHDEPGYIYIFWLTAEDSGPAPSSTASDLLTPPTTSSRARSHSDVMRQYSVKAHSNGAAARGVADTSSAAKGDTILLKIGRANNVTRRMNEWTRQCGYELSLVRFYPYVSSSAPAANGASPGDVHKVPNVNRVERLVHLELGNTRVLKQCEACGKEHREWFEVDASREGVKRVDEVIRRWVEWAEANA